jgi:glycosyltransferase involved in cell wall biosynthesis
MVFLSLVMPVLNRVSLIDAALDSVAAQGAGHAIEIVVVDGGSDDGTQARVRDRGDLTIRLIDAPGSSVYRALNMGILAATGEVVGNLNSDDLLAPGAFHHLDHIFRDADIVALHGASLLVDEDGTASEHRYPPGLDRMRIMMGTPAINALFVRRDVFDRVGLFDERWRIASDRDWLLRLLRAGVPVTKLDQLLYCFRSHEGSLTLHQDWTRLMPAYDEYRAIAEAILADRSIGGEERKLARLWHARQITVLMAALAQRGKLARMSVLAKQAFAADPGWPIAGGGWLARRLGRGR